MKRREEGYVLADTLTALGLTVIITAGITVYLNNAFIASVKTENMVKELIEMENNLAETVYECRNRE